MFQLNRFGGLVVHQMYFMISGYRDMCNSHIENQTSKSTWICSAPETTWSSNKTGFLLRQNWNNITM